PTQLLGKTRPRTARLLVLLNAQHLTQQMRNAFLLRQTLDRVVSAPEVAYQDPPKLPLEELHEHRSATTTIDQIKRRVAGREAPQPPRFAFDTPTGFVREHDLGVEDVALNFL